MKGYLFFLLIFLIGCQQSGKTDLQFADIAGNPPTGNSQNDNSLDGLEIPVFQNTVEVELPISLVLVDRYYVLNKFTELFGITPNELAPDHGQLTIYDKIKPAIYSFGHFGGGCDYYASTNAWAPKIKDAGSTVRIDLQAYKILPGITQEYWHDSCWNFHLAFKSYSGLAPIDWVEANQSSSARWAVNTRICHLLTKDATSMGNFLTDKMGFNPSALPDFSDENLITLMQAFHPAYEPRPNEIEALAHVYTGSIATNANKLEMWRTATQAVCQSPFWHSP
jgi:hypothetical protein